MSKIVNRVSRYSVIYLNTLASIVIVTLTLNLAWSRVCIEGLQIPEKSIKNTDHNGFEFLWKHLKNLVYGPYGTTLAPYTFRGPPEEYSTSRRAPTSSRNTIVQESFTNSYSTSPYKTVVPNSSFHQTSNTSHTTKSTPVHRTSLSHSNNSTTNPNVTQLLANQNPPSSTSELNRLLNRLNLTRDTVYQMFKVLKQYLEVEEASWRNNQFENKPRRSNPLQIKVDQTVESNDMRALNQIINHLVSPRPVVRKIQMRTGYRRNIRRNSPQDFSHEFVQDLMNKEIQYRNESCAVNREFVCSQDLLGLPTEGDVAVLPKLYPVSFCPQDRCSCEHFDQVCRASDFTQIDSHFMVLQNQSSGGTAKRDVLYLTQITACSCQTQCLNRRCLPPFSFVTGRNPDLDIDCKCICDVSTLTGTRKTKKEKYCHDLLEGKKKFRNTQCLLTGHCLPPACKHGPMSLLDMVRGYCPSVVT